ncbi:hypothetical protein MTZ49_06580 [Entomomonas sp. E2T0]|uniref:transglycosylase SLT domain-containing protein n=1 Tax=Entomomonas sp. E2T0 TaxID=2930213 RepID=UPI0022283735|nr:hypothetical protein [Entomomonas sp. E2T0]UYZ85520.1 hypothetical protein MTZ49_06580 [Entomomonas sp. E2T0]
MGKYLLPLILLVVITGCADRPPQNLDNICSIYKEKRHWYKASLNTERRWGVPPQVPMAFMHQESKFDGSALPPRKYILWIIPWGRVSTAYGFAQAQTMTWNDYIKDTGNSGAKRNNFADSMDFIGWYMDKTQKVNGVSKWDAYNQYLNYHEGWGGYKRKTYNSKSWLLGVAQKVKTRSSNYGAQYSSCKEELMKPQGFWEWILGV